MSLPSRLQVLMPCPRSKLRRCDRWQGASVRLPCGLAGPLPMLTTALLVRYRLLPIPKIMALSETLKECRCPKCMVASARLFLLCMSRRHFCGCCQCQAQSNGARGSHARSGRAKLAQQSEAACSKAQLQRRLCNRPAARSLSLAATSARMAAVRQRVAERCKKISIPVASSSMFSFRPCRYSSVGCSSAVSIVVPASKDWFA